MVYLQTLRQKGHFCGFRFLASYFNHKCKSLDPGLGEVEYRSEGVVIHKHALSRITSLVSSFWNSWANHSDAWRQQLNKWRIGLSRKSRRCWLDGAEWHSVNTQHHKSKISRHNWSLHDSMTPWKLCVAYSEVVKEYIYLKYQTASKHSHNYNCCSFTMFTDVCSFWDGL